jgi:hypothetical protein
MLLELSKLLDGIYFETGAGWDNVARDVGARAFADFSWMDYQSG